MKKVLSVIFLFAVLFCSCAKPVDNSFSKKQSDSITYLKGRLDTVLQMAVIYEESLVAMQNTDIIQDSIIKSLKDSISGIRSVSMTKSQFIELYKYKRLEKYYYLCKKRTSYWKYYKGWSTRVFELENKKYKPTDFVPDIKF